MSRLKLNGMSYDTALATLASYVSELESRIAKLEKEPYVEPNVTCICKHEPDYTGVPHRFECPIYSLVRS